MSCIKYVCEVRSLAYKTKDRLALRKSVCEHQGGLWGWGPHLRNMQLLIIYPVLPSIQGRE